MPVIEARWHIDRRRETLVGHSFGGLLGVHAWLTRPALFDHVVVVSPSFWFGDGFLAREAAIARDAPRGTLLILNGERSEEHKSELPSLMRLSYDAICLQKNTK